MKAQLSRKKLHALILNLKKEWLNPKLKMYSSHENIKNFDIFVSTLPRIIQENMNQ